MTKEYIYKLEIHGEDVIWKCVISDDTCMTYEGDTLCETFRLTTKERKPQVLQLDTKAKVYGEILPLQVENGMPFLKMDGKWEASHTTDEDRLQAKIRAHKKEAYSNALLGVLMIVYYFIDKKYIGLVSEFPIALVMGIFCVSSCGVTLFRLKNELQEMGRTLDWKPHLSDFKKQN